MPHPHPEELPLGLLMVFEYVGLLMGFEYVGLLMVFEYSCVSVRRREREEEREEGELIDSCE